MRITGIGFLVSILLLIIELSTALPASAQQDPPVLQPVWEMHSEDGYIYMEGWPGCDLVFVLTYQGGILALDAGGEVAWSIDPNMSWPDMAWAPEGALWISDGAGIARVSEDGDLTFNTNAFTAGEYSGEPAAAGYVDIETELIYGFAPSSVCTWESAKLAPDMLLASLLPTAGQFVVEGNDFDNATQVFFGLGTDGTVNWQFDATAYGQMPIVGQYPVLREDGSLLLAPVTHSGDIGGEWGEYGPLLSLSAGGELEWQYLENAYLLTYFPSADGSVQVVLPDYTIRRVDRDGRDLWVYSYDREEYLWDCLMQRDGGALVFFRLAEGELFEQPTLRVVRVGADGAVAGEWQFARPEDTYWYLRQLGNRLVCLDGDYRIAAFELP